MEMDTSSGFLCARDVNEFHENGYILKRNVFNEKEISDLSNAVDRVLQISTNVINKHACAALSSVIEHSVHIDGSKVVFRVGDNDSASSIARINGVCGMGPLLLNTLQSNKMVNTFFDLLGVSTLEHIIAQLHPKMPGDGISFPTHRDIQFRRSFDLDWEDVAGNGSYAICIIPIDGMTKENGGMYLYPDSYRRKEDDGSTFEEIPEHVVWMETAPGDLLFLHPHIFHGSGSNASTSLSRRTLLTGFCAFGANHRAYPGAHVNMKFTKYVTEVLSSTPSSGRDRSPVLATNIISEPCPWKEERCTSDANH